ncbi:hypothetical protein M427DRAFT_133667 [Gonapodya prolifera JEL478]|uniref:VLRF1 domain-containing protein n=1 Tax=Gonapodya prolifera (strain JEL478) TaxID=1344416 RepID=A0A139AKD4_GONPJ|nr:hypothetical protein M427DRAFT_133667 [Gonapodya prolifera JEL478]|eukprot:KXS17237.1 hypothetical protein M427DRAFT_133667 [Gonapodya prolifera JEL478]
MSHTVASLSLFVLGSSGLLGSISSSVTVDASVEATLANSDSIEDRTPIPTPSETRESSALSCSACGVLSFETVADQRVHFKSDWHRFNVKRRLKSLQAVSEEVFDDLSDVSSIEGSDSSDNEEDEGDDFTAKDAGQHGRDKSHKMMADITKSRPVFAFPISADGVLPSSSKATDVTGATGPNPTDKPQRDRAVLVYKCLFEYPAPTQTLVERLAALQPPSKAINVSAIATPQRTWTIVLLSSGHFAIATFQLPTTPPSPSNPLSTKPVLSKSFHRYTTRRKQGGSQSTMDSSKGNANSAGAGLRRYNEKALMEEVRGALESAEWKKLIANSERVFYHAAGRGNRQVIFGYEGAVLKELPTLRTLPFPTKRPTLTELQRIFREISTVRVVEVEPAKPTSPSVAPLTPNGAPKNASPDKSQEAAQAPEQEKTLIDPVTQAKLLDFASRGKTPLLTTTLSTLLDRLLPVHSDLTLSALVNSPFKIDSPSSSSNATTTLLHTSSKAAHPDTVTALLDLGANPTKLSRGKTPYELAPDRPTRDVFRRFRARAGEPAWDWRAARVAEPLTPEMEEERDKKEAEKKKKEREKEKARAKEKKEREREAAANTPPTPPSASSKPAASRTILAASAAAPAVRPPASAATEREKRALAAEWRVRAMTGKCVMCGGMIAQGRAFERMGYKYCSTDCVQGHREYIG